MYNVQKTFSFNSRNNASISLKTTCTETIENLETSINGTKKEMADNFQLQETYKENTNKEVNSLKIKTNDLEEITNVLSVEESCQQLSNLGTVYILGQ